MNKITSTPYRDYVKDCIKFGVTPTYVQNGIIFV